MRRLIPLVLLTAALTACGGKGGSPTSPSAGAPAPATPSSGFTATISGTVQAPGAIAVVSTFGTSNGAALSGVTVTVVGTSLTVTADAAGRFSLTNVPPGDVQLRVTAPGTDATVPVPQVQASQSVDLVIVVAGSSASVDSDVRNTAGDGELEGRVEALPPTTPALTFTAAGRTVKTDSSTQFVEGSATRTFADLQIGERVHVKGRVSGDTFTAASVLIQNTNTTIPVEVNGVIDTLTGTAASFQFKIGSRVVRGDATTVFFGDGDTPDTFGRLKDGVRVEVTGDQRNDFVFATRIHINGTNDAPTPPGQDTSASIQGTLKSLSGTKPNLVLTVDTTTVKTTGSTEVKRKGDVQTLDALVVGQSLHVEGQRQSDGSIVARLIEIDDDAPGGAFEIEGALGGLKGTCPSISFGVNGFQIATNSTTTFEGGTCASLKSGDTVQVEGTRNADGSVAATSVKKE